MGVISRLFGLYRASPFWLKEVIGRSTVPLRIVMQPFAAVRMGGYEMVLDFADNASFKYFVDRDDYERVERSGFLAMAVANAPCTVVDLGASYGSFTLPAGLLSRQGFVRRVHAVEPDRRPSKALRRSVQKNGLSGCVTVHEVVASDDEGTETLFVNARSSADNRSHVVAGAPIRERERYDRRSTTIDRLLAADADLGTLVVKMDIQGNEPRALSGMTGSLSRARGWVIFFEHAPYLIESAGNDLGAYEQFLEELEPDTFFEITESGFERLEGIDGFRRVLARIEGETSERMQGTGTNFVIAKGVNAECLRLYIPDRRGA